MFDKAYEVPKKKGKKERRGRPSKIPNPSPDSDESDASSTCSYDFDVVKSCDNPRFARFWELVGRSFTDTDENETFKITAVCKCDGKYFFRYVPAAITRPKAADYEHTPVSELLKADWFELLIEESEDSGDENVVVRKKQASQSAVEAGRKSFRR